MPHRGPRFRLTALLLAVLVIALGLAAYVHHRQSRTPWELTGGMIGWRHAAIERRLGPPSRVFETDAGDTEARQLRPKPPGTCRTLVFRHFDGEIVVRLIAEGDHFV